MTEELSEDELERLDLFRCHCGFIGKMEEMFDESIYEQGCGGSGILHCECGGDICVCHHHGEIPCIGCDDCEADEDDEGFEDDDQ